jgi:hypothetical protein
MEDGFNVIKIRDDNFLSRTSWTRCMANFAGIISQPEQYIGFTTDKCFLSYGSNLNHSFFNRLNMHVDYPSTNYIMPPTDMKPEASGRNCTVLNALCGDGKSPWVDKVHMSNDFSFVCGGRQRQRYGKPPAITHAGAWIISIRSLRQE